MTKAVETPLTRFSGNGSSTTFAAGFEVFDLGDIVVELYNGSTAVSIALDGSGTYDYTVTGSLDTDTDRYLTPSVVFNTAPPSGYTIGIGRASTLEQSLNLTLGASLPAESVERRLDRIVAMIQELSEWTDRSLAENYALDGIIQAGSRIIRGVSDPVLDSDATNKSWVAGVASAAAANAAGIEAPIVANVTAAKALTLADGDWVYIKGLGMYVYDADGTATTNDVTVITPTQGGRLIMETAVRVTAQSYGAVGDGVTDDYAALQDYIDNENVIDLGGPGFTYLISQTLDIPSNRRIDGRGATLDMSQISTGSLTGMACAGTGLGTGVALTGGATLNSFTVTMADTSAFAAGDLVQISSTDVIPYDGAYNVYQGEILEVRTVVANTSVSFTTALTKTYTTSPKLYPVTWKENVHIRDLKVVGEDTAALTQRGIALRYVKNFSVVGCDFVYQDAYQLELSTAVRGHVERNTFKGVFYDGVTGTVFYGIAVLDSCRWLVIDRNIGSRVRHLVVTSAHSTGQGWHGQPRDLVISNNNAHDSMAGGGGRSYAFENHGFGEGIVWGNNWAHGAYSFMRLLNGTDNAVIGGGVRGYGYAGIIIGSSTAANVAIRNLKISDVLISGYTSEVTAGNPAGIRFDACASRENVKITDCILDGVADGTYGHGISIGGSSGGDTNCEIRDCTIAAKTVTDKYGIITATGTDNWTFAGNNIHDFYNGIGVFGDNCRISGGKVSVDSAAGSGFGIYSDGDRTVATEVQMVNIHTVIRLDTNSTNCLVTRNYLTGCTVTTPSDAGSSNTTSGNVVV